MTPGGGQAFQPGRTCKGRFGQAGKPGPTKLSIMKDEASYICDSCGEEIVVPIDLSAGAAQEYVEDCPVCCRANVIRIEIDEDGDVRVWAEKE
jgi:hypothetical protein